MIFKHNLFSSVINGGIGLLKRGHKIFMNFTEHVKIRNEKFGSVIFETLTEKIFITNETGTKILEFIGQGMDLLQITDELQKIYLEGQKIENDIVDFVDCLKKNNFIV